MTSRVARVQITCLCDSIKIPDLGVELQRGDSKVMVESVANGSQDLARAARMRAVKLTVFLGPRRVLPRKPPPKPKLAKPTPPPKEAPDVAALLREAAAAALSPHVANMSRQIDAAATSAANKAVERVVQVLSQAPAAPAAPAAQPAVDTEWLEAVVRSALAGAGGHLATSGVISDGDMPMFIPSGMTKGIQGDVGAVEESSTGSGVDEARDALKALRKKKKREATDG